MSGARERIAFAADLPLEESIDVYRRVAPNVGWVKVGLSLFVEHGPRAVSAFQALSAKVFLDLKLHDIPNTVERAASRAASLGVGLLSVHAWGGRAMLEAALRGARSGASGSPPRLLAVTVLTSMSGADLEEIGLAESAASQAMRLAHLAARAGIDGLVCSAKEALALRQELGPSCFLCTPGIRPAGAAAGDQRRIETPGAAVRAGSNLLVVGRPIYEAPDPSSAAAAIAREVEEALAAPT